MHGSEQGLFNGRRDRENANLSSTLNLKPKPSWRNSFPEFFGYVERIPRLSRLEALKSCFAYKTVVHPSTPKKQSLWKGVRIWNLTKS